MKYDAIDRVFLPWASREGLTVATEHRGEEVRSAEITDDHGRRYQLWLDPPESDQVQVHAWDFGRARADLVTQIDNLEASLDEALATISEWKRENFRQDS